MKKLIFTVLTAFSLAAVPAFAQTPAPAPAPAAVDPAAAQAVRELLTSMKYRQLMDGAFQATLKNIPTMVLQAATSSINGNPNLNDAQKKEALDKAAQNIPKAAAAAQAVFADPKLIDDIVEEIIPLYARYFTAVELRQLAEFYKTPLGTKMLTTMPQIMNEAMQIGQRVVGPRLNKQLEAATRNPAP